MSDLDFQARKRFRELHCGDAGFVLPNPWDLGSARILASLGFEALATTSAGHAATLGRLDGNVTRAEAIEHARSIVGATELPVSADLEDGFGSRTEDVALTIAQADAVGLAGCSIEDWDPRAGALYAADVAAERVRVAAEVAHRAQTPLVLTGRCENFLRGKPDLADTIARLRAYQEAGAEVLYAPGLRELDDVRALVESLDRPVNVLLLPGGPSLRELFSVGVRRVSLGGALQLAAHAALVAAARELRESGTHDFWARILPELQTIRSALAP